MGNQHATNGRRGSSSHRRSSEKTGGGGGATPTTTISGNSARNRNPAPVTHAPASRSPAAQTAEQISHYADPSPRGTITTRRGRSASLTSATQSPGRAHTSPSVSPTLHLSETASGATNTTAAAAAAAPAGRAASHAPSMSSISAATAMATNRKFGRLSPEPSTLQRDEEGEEREQQQQHNDDDGGSLPMDRSQPRMSRAGSLPRLPNATFLSADEAASVLTSDGGGTLSIPMSNKAGNTGSDGERNTTIMDTAAAAAVVTAQAVAVSESAGTEVGPADGHVMAAAAAAARTAKQEEDRENLGSVEAREVELEDGNVGSTTSSHGRGGGGEDAGTLPHTSDRADGTNTTSAAAVKSTEESPLPLLIVRSSRQTSISAARISAADETSVPAAAAAEHPRSASPEARPPAQENKKNGTTVEKAKKAKKSSRSRLRKGGGDEEGGGEGEEDENDDGRSATFDGSESTPAPPPPPPPKHSGGVMGGLFNRHSSKYLFRKSSSATAASATAAKSDREENKSKRSKSVVSVNTEKESRATSVTKESAQRSDKDKRAGAATGATADPTTVTVTSTGGPGLRGRSADSGSYTERASQLDEAAGPRASGSPSDARAAAAAAAVSSPNRTDNSPDLAYPSTAPTVLVKPNSSAATAASGADAGEREVSYTTNTAPTTTTTNTTTTATTALRQTASATNVTMTTNATATATRATSFPSDSAVPAEDPRESTATSACDVGKASGAAGKRGGAVVSVLLPAVKSAMRSGESSPLLPPATTTTTTTTTTTAAAVDKITRSNTSPLNDASDVALGAEATPTKTRTTALTQSSENAEASPTRQSASTGAQAVQGSTSTNPSAPSDKVSCDEQDEGDSAEAASAVDHDVCAQEIREASTPSEAEDKRKVVQEEMSEGNYSTTSTDTNSAPILPPPPTASFAEAMWGAQTAAQSALQHDDQTNHHYYNHHSRVRSGEAQRIVGAAAPSTSGSNSSTGANSSPIYSPRPFLSRSGNYPGFQGAATSGATTVTDTTARVSPRSPFTSPPPSFSSLQQQQQQQQQPQQPQQQQLVFAAQLPGLSDSRSPTHAAALEEDGRPKGRKTVSQSAIIAAWNRMGARSGATLPASPLNALTVTSTTLNLSNSNATTTSTPSGGGGGGGARAGNGGVSTVTSFGSAASGGVRSPDESSRAADGAPLTTPSPAPQTRQQQKEEKEAVTTVRKNSSAAEHTVVMPVRRRSVLTRQRGHPVLFPPPPNDSGNNNSRSKEDSVEKPEETLPEVLQASSLTNNRDHYNNSPTIAESLAGRGGGGGTDKQSAHTDVAAPQPAELESMKSLATPSPTEAGNAAESNEVSGFLFNVNPLPTFYAVQAGNDRDGTWTATTSVMSPPVRSSDDVSRPEGPQRGGGDEHASGTTTTTTTMAATSTNATTSSSEKAAEAGKRREADDAATSQLLLPPELPSSVPPPQLLLPAVTNGAEETTSNTSTTIRVQHLSEDEAENNRHDLESPARGRIELESDADGGVDGDADNFYLLNNSEDENGDEDAQPSHRDHHQHHHQQQPLASFAHASSTQLAHPSSRRPSAASGFTTTHTTRAASTTVTTLEPQFLTSPRSVSGASSPGVEQARPVQRVVPPPPPAQLHDPVSSAGLVCSHPPSPDSPAEYDSTEVSPHRDDRRHGHPQPRHRYADRFRRGSAVDGAMEHHSMALDVGSSHNNTIDAAAAAVAVAPTPLRSGLPRNSSSTTGGTSVATTSAAPQPPTFHRKEGAGESRVFQQLASPPTLTGTLLSSSLMSTVVLTNPAATPAQYAGGAMAGQPSSSATMFPGVAATGDNTGSPVQRTAQHQQQQQQQQQQHPQLQPTRSRGGNFQPAQTGSSVSSARLMPSWRERLTPIHAQSTSARSLSATRDDATSGRSGKGEAEEESSDNVSPAGSRRRRLSSASQGPPPLPQQQLQQHQQQRCVSSSAAGATASSPQLHRDFSNSGVQWKEVSLLTSATATPNGGPALLGGSGREEVDVDDVGRRRYRPLRPHDGGHHHIDPPRRRPSDFGEEEEEEEEQDGDGPFYSNPQRRRRSSLRPCRKSQDGLRSWGSGQSPLTWAVELPSQQWRQDGVTTEDEERQFDDAAEEDEEEEQRNYRGGSSAHPRQTSSRSNPHEHPQMIQQHTSRQRQEQDLRSEQPPHRKASPRHVQERLRALQRSGSGRHQSTHHYHTHHGRVFSPRSVPAAPFGVTPPQESSLPSTPPDEFSRRNTEDFDNIVDDDDVDDAEEEEEEEDNVAAAMRDEDQGGRYSRARLYHNRSASPPFTSSSPSDQDVPHTRTTTAAFADLHNSAANRAGILLHNPSSSSGGAGGGGGDNSTVDMDAGRVPLTRYEPPMPSNRNTFTAFVPLSDISSSHLLTSATAIFQAGYPPAESGESGSSHPTSGAATNGSGVAASSGAGNAPSNLDTPATADTLLLTGCSLPGMQRPASGRSELGAVTGAGGVHTGAGAAQLNSPLFSSVSTAPTNHVSTGGSPIPLALQESRGVFGQHGGAASAEADAETEVVLPPPPPYFLQRSDGDTSALQRAREAGVVIALPQKRKSVLKAAPRTLHAASAPGAVGESGPVPVTAAIHPLTQPSSQHEQQPQSWDLKTIAAGPPHSTPAVLLVTTNTTQIFSPTEAVLAQAENEDDEKEDLTAAAAVVGNLVLTPAIAAGHTGAHAAPLTMTATMSTAVLSVVEDSASTSLEGGSASAAGQSRRSSGLPSSGNESAEFQQSSGGGDNNKVSERVALFAASAARVGAPAYQSQSSPITHLRRKSSSSSSSATSSRNSSSGIVGGGQGSGDARYGVPDQPRLAPFTTTTMARTNSEPMPSFPPHRTNSLYLNQSQELPWWNRSHAAHSEGSGFLAELSSRGGNSGSSSRLVGSPRSPYSNHHHHNNNTNNNSSSGNAGSGLPSSSPTTRELPSGSPPRLESTGVLPQQQQLRNAVAMGSSGDAAGVASSVLLESTAELQNVMTPTAGSETHTFTNTKEGNDVGAAGVVDDDDEDVLVHYNDTYKNNRSRAAAGQKSEAVDGGVLRFKFVQSFEYDEGQDEGSDDNNDEEGEDEEEDEAQYLRGGADAETDYGHPHTRNNDSDRHDRDDDEADSLNEEENRTITGGVKTATWHLCSPLSASCLPDVHPPSTHTTATAAAQPTQHDEDEDGTTSSLVSDTTAAAPAAVIIPATTTFLEVSDALHAEEKTTSNAQNAASASAHHPAQNSHRLSRSGSSSVAAAVAFDNTVETLLEAETYTRACIEESAADVVETWLAVWAALQQAASMASPILLSGTLAPLQPVEREDTTQTLVTEENNNTNINHNDNGDNDEEDEEEDGSGARGCGNDARDYRRVRRRDGRSRGMRSGRRLATSPSTPNPSDLTTARGDSEPPSPSTMNATLTTTTTSQSAPPLPPPLSVRLMLGAVAVSAGEASNPTPRDDNEEDDEDVDRHSSANAEAKRGAATTATTLMETEGGGGSSDSLSRKEESVPRCSYKADAPLGMGDGDGEPHQNFTVPIGGASLPPPSSSTETAGHDGVATDASGHMSTFIEGDVSGALNTADVDESARADSPVVVSTVVGGADAGSWLAYSALSAPTPTAQDATPVGHHEEDEEEQRTRSMGTNRNDAGDGGVDGGGGGMEQESPSFFLFGPSTTSGFTQHNTPSAHSGDAEEPTRDHDATTSQRANQSSSQTPARRNDNLNNNNTNVETIDFSRETERANAPHQDHDGASPPTDVCSTPPAGAAPAASRSVRPLVSPQRDASDDEADTGDHDASTTALLFNTANGEKGHHHYHDPHRSRSRSSESSQHRSGSRRSPDRAPSPSPRAPTSLTSPSVGAAGQRSRSAQRRPSVGQVVCRWCGSAYTSSVVCPVARRIHQLLREERKKEKAAKRQAQALLCEGRVSEAVALLKEVGLYVP